MIAQPQATRPRWFTGHILVFMAVALFLVAMISAASAEQTWYLSSTQSSGGTYYMYDTWGHYGYIEIPANGETIWITKDCAHHAITFNKGDWTLIVRGESGSSNEFNATIGTYAGDGFTPITQTLLGCYSGSGDCETFYLNDSDGFTVSKGDYLALQIVNTADNALTIACICEEDGVGSSVASPAGSPGYPYPELSTVVLFGIGLLTLVGYVGYRRRTTFT